ncbi:hypothetical protein BH11ACT6_BH11ACT6_34890 [soil metagenome]
MPLPAQYASPADLVAYWRPMSVAEQERATVLLGFAAALINEQPGAADADGEPAFSAATCKHVSLDMVKRAMLSRGDGALETSAEMADMRGTVRYANPVGNLYLSSREISRLQGPSPQIFSLTPTSNVRVPGQPWNHQNSSQTE